jgi:hypothetical protein
MPLEPAVEFLVAAVECPDNESEESAQLVGTMP